MTVLRFLGLFMAVALFSVGLQAQCDKFSNYPADKGGEAEAKKIHVLYRDLVKADKYEEALEKWQVMEEYCFGAIEWHALDGVKIYEDMAEKAEDAEKKKEYQQKVLSLYDRYIECFGKSNKKKADLLRRKGRYMFYYAKSDYADTYQNYAKCVELGGKSNTSYSIYSPYLFVAVSQFKSGEVSADDMRKLYFQLKEIAEHNIENAKDEKSKERYQKALEQLDTSFEPIKYDVFDCEYFVKKFTPEFNKNYGNADYLEYEMLYNLKDANCDPTNEFVVKVANRVKAIKDSIRIANMSNEDYGDKYYNERNYPQAISYYDKAIAEDPLSNEGKAKLSLRIAKMHAIEKDFSKSVSYCEKALSFDPNNGEAYIQMGDAFMAGSGACGSTFDRQTVAWVAIDVYSKARSVDPSVADKASQRISKYSGFMPTKTELFTRTISEGSSYRVGCWINRTTTVRGVNE